MNKTTKPDKKSLGSADLKKQKTQLQHPSVKKQAGASSQHPEKENTSQSKQKKAGSKKSSHDRFFKQSCSNLEFVVEIFKLIFSKKEFNACDWKNLKAEKDTLKGGKRADLVFSVPLKKKPDTRLKIFILLEHKSSYSQNLFTQILYYQVLLHEQTLKEYGKAQPIIPVLFYQGKEPWRWESSFQAVYFGKCFNKIPAFFKENMLNYKLRVLDIHSPEVARALKSKNFKNRGTLNLLKEIWNLEMTEEDLMRVLSKFDKILDDDTVLGIMDYLKDFGMTKKLWQKVERRAYHKNIFQKGGYMGVREDIREEGRMEGVQAGIQKGRQERDRQVILNMLKEKMDVSVISKVTGLSSKEIQKLKKNDS